MTYTWYISYIMILYQDQLIKMLKPYQATWGLHVTFKLLEIAVTSTLDQDQNNDLCIGMFT